MPVIISLVCLTQKICRLNYLRKNNLILFLEIFKYNYWVYVPFPVNLSIVFDPLVVIVGEPVLVPE